MKKKVALIISCTILLSFCVGHESEPNMVETFSSDSISIEELVRRGAQYGTSPSHPESEIKVYSLLRNDTALDVHYRDGRMLLSILRIKNLRTNSEEFIKLITEKLKVSSVDSNTVGRPEKSPLIFTSGTLMVHITVFDSAISITKMIRSTDNQGDIEPAVAH